MTRLETVGRFLGSLVLLGGVATAPSLQRETAAPEPSLRVLHDTAELQPEATSVPVRRTRPLEDLGSERIHRDPKPLPSTLAAIPHDLPIRAQPGSGETIGTMPAGSPWFNVPTVAWIHRISPNGRFGKVTVPYNAAPATGWISLDGLELSTTRYTARADISKRELTIVRSGSVIMRFPVAIGTATAPTPPGRYFVTDRIPFDASGPLGPFAFGISGIQPDLPPGWYGGDQLAIHGTNDPSSIGTAASAGCLRVSSEALDRLMPILQPGTPVVFRP